MPRFENKVCMSASDARPIFIRPATTSVARRKSVGDPLVVDVDHRSRNGRAGVGGGDAGTHLPGPQHADAADGPRLDVGIGHAPVAGEQVLHEEDADQRRRNGRADNAERLLQLDLQSLPATAD